MSIILFVITVLSRIPFVSKYLYHTDSGHFVLGMKHYDVMLHQPHPPGYFLYVMLGRLFNLFVSDANTALVLLSILFSGFTVTVIYTLGKEVFDNKTGVLAALLALSSPNFWFNGEIALTYSMEAFFSALIGLLCWRISQGKKNSIWLAMAVLALAGGFRQNTPFFLIPMWLYAVRKERLSRIIASLIIFALVSLSWFLPMLLMTGGVDYYLDAFRELWSFNTGRNTALQKGWPAIRLYGEVVYVFIFYTLAAALPVLLLAFYSLLRNRQASVIANQKTLFLSAWLVPSILFYLLVFISPVNPGYLLIVLPPLILISAKAITYLSDEIQAIHGKYYLYHLACIVLFLNTSIFLFSNLPVSRNEIVKHDRNLFSLFNTLRTFNPTTTILFMDHYLYSYRHIMVYLPEYQVYQVDIRTSPTGELRKMYGGKNGVTSLTKAINLPKEVNTFATLVVHDSEGHRNIPARFSRKIVASNSVVAFGPIDEAHAIYPELKPYLYHKAYAYTPSTKD